MQRVQAAATKRKGMLNEATSFGDVSPQRLRRGGCKGRSGSTLLSLIIGRHVSGLRLRLCLRLHLAFVVPAAVRTQGGMVSALVARAGLRRFAAEFTRCTSDRLAGQHLMKEIPRRHLLSANTTRLEKSARCLEGAVGNAQPRQTPDQATRAISRLSTI